MNLKNRPKLRISLYHYGSTFGEFLFAFRDTALKQGWSENEVDVLIDSTNAMKPLKALEHLMQYACIVKLPKGCRIKNGKPISKTAY